MTGAWTGGVTHGVTSFPLPRSRTDRALHPVCIVRVTSLPTRYVGQDSSSRKIGQCPAEIRNPTLLQPYGHTALTRPSQVKPTNSYFEYREWSGPRRRCSPPCP